MTINFTLNKSIILSFIIFSSIIIGCNHSNEKDYRASVQKWHQLRIDSLKGETGFLNLAGLYWLDSGVNTFGSDSTNDLDFSGAAAFQMGSFLLQDSLVYLIPSVPIKISGEAVEDTVLVFSSSQAPVMVYNSLHWFVIKRGEHIGVRLRDFNHPLLSSFDSIDYFETNPEWKVKAKWIPYKYEKNVPFSNVLGMTIDYPVYGAFKFSVDDEEYQLEPLGNPSETDGYFIMFYDKTSGHSTYGSGRYLYVAEPDSLGYSFVDFNKAYNPPCAFTEFATCLFPHKKNRLPIFVKAGEKFSRH